MEYYWQGLVLGLAYVAPIGMQNLYVINNSLNAGFWHSLLGAIIVIFFDITLAGTCFFGIGYLLEKFLWLQMVLLLAGGLAVIKIGYELTVSHVTAVGRPVQTSLITVVKTACIVTWFNPQAIWDGTLLLGGMKAALAPDMASYFIAGVCTASFIWFTGLSVIVFLIKTSFSESIILYINRICGIIIMAYGVKLLYHLLNMVGKG